MRRLNALLFSALLALNFYSVSFASTIPPETTALPVAMGSADFDTLLAKKLDGNALATESLFDGSYRLSNTVQTVSAHITQSGVRFDSIGNSSGKGGFGLEIANWGREDALQHADSLQIYREGDTVFHAHNGGIAEKFSNTTNGIRQDFIVPVKPAGAGELHIQLQLSDAIVTAKQDGAVIALASGRQLTYDRLHVTDNNGKTIPARMAIAQNTVIDVVVDDRGAQYPLTIDPTIGDANWVSMGAHAGTNGEVDALLIVGNTVYIAGQFSIAGNVPANHIAKWDGSNWSGLGTGIDTYAAVNALAADSSGNIYAGGNFTTAGGVAAKNIAKWNGTAWSALGAGANGSVSVLTFDTGGTLYVGGQFSSAGGIAVNNVARWNGSNWSALDASVYNGGWVNELTFDSNGNLYAAGSFTALGGVTASNIAKWNGATWSALGVGTNGQVGALFMDNNNLYVGGYFTTAGGVAASHVALWNGTAWSNIGSVAGDVLTFAKDANNKLYAGGRSGGTAGLVSKFDGTSWNTIGSMDHSVMSLAADSSGNLFAGGWFWNVEGTVIASNIAKWNGSAWTALSPGAASYSSGTKVYAMARDTSGNLYIGGYFDTFGGVFAKNIAKWNGSSWSALGVGTDNAVNAIAVDNSGNVYAGGNFSTAGGVGVDRIAKWNGSNWSTMGGMDGAVMALTLDSSGNLYAGGQFVRTSVGSVLLNGLAKWNGGTSWTRIGVSGGNSFVKALAADTSGNLYVGGDFTVAGGISANNIAKWNGSSWVAMSTQGMSAIVNALALDASSNVYAGGGFISAGGVPAAYIAKWNGSSWSALGSGLAVAPHTLAVDSYGTLYAGTQSYGNNMFKWNGTAWAALGQGLDHAVSAMQRDGQGNILVGGFFQKAGDKVSVALAKWLVIDTDGDKWQDYEDAFPLNPAEWLDTDGDGTGNNSDAFPLDPAEWLDTDSDGTGNNADLDDDGDSVPDYVDAEPLNPANASEIRFPLNGIYKGSVVRDSSSVL